MLKKGFSLVPGTAGALGLCLCDGPGRQVAKGAQNLFCVVPPLAGQFAQRRAKRLQPEVILAGGPFSTIEERRDFDKLVPGVEEVQVEDLLPRHIVVAEYKTKSADSNRK